MAAWQSGRRQRARAALKHTWSKGRPCSAVRPPPPLTHELTPPPRKGRMQGRLRLRRHLPPRRRRRPLFSRRQCRRRRRLRARVCAGRLVGVLWHKHTKVMGRCSLLGGHCALPSTLLHAAHPRKATFAFAAFGIVTAARGRRRQVCGSSAALPCAGAQLLPSGQAGGSRALLLQYIAACARSAARIVESAFKFVLIWVPEPTSSPCAPIIWLTWI